MEFLISPLHAFGHFLFLFFRLQKLTRIPYRHRPRETVYIFDPIEYSFDGHTQRRLVDHTQDEMTLQYLSEGFEGLIESVLFRVGVRPWHMYPIGVLFGLGFDTATENCSSESLGGSCSQRVIRGCDGGIPSAFNGGNDSGRYHRLNSDGWSLRMGVYEAHPQTVLQSHHYLRVGNRGTAGGGIEAIGLLNDQLNMTGGFWDFIGSVNDNFGTLGFVIIGVFVLSWVGSVIIYLVEGFDRFESTTTTAD